MNRLKLLREEKGLNQTELGKIVNVSGQALGMYENEKRDMNTDILKKLADYFGVSIDYLLGKSDIRNPEKVEADPLDLAKFGFSMKDYKPLSEKQKEQVRDLLKIVLKDNLKDKDNKDE